MKVEGYYEAYGFVFPSWDQRIPDLTMRAVGNIRQVLSHCDDLDVVVQAGGNCGVWPKLLAQEFSTVYTFEPDNQNFLALAFNTSGCKNVIRFQAALGDCHSLVDMRRNDPEIKNCGAYFVDGLGNIPTMRIDDLGLQVCDLIYLDIEGSEMAAFMGARETISRCNPVICFEDKSHGHRYGVQSGEIESLLAAYGYAVVDKANHDIILKHRGDNA